MLVLLKTFLDIILIRKGPDDLPHSPVLLSVAVLFWCIAFLLAYITFEWLDGRRLVIACAASILAVMSFQLVLAVFGKTARSLQTQTALIACGSLISIASVLLMAIGLPFEQQSKAVYQTMGIGSELVSLWSVPVKGHIISRAVNVHWYVGIVIAGGIFILQYIFLASVTTTQ